SPQEHPMFARIASLAFVILIAPVLASAQALVDRIPEDAMLYIGWRGSADLGPGYAQSNLKTFLDQSQVRQLIDEFLPQVMEKVGQMNPQARDVMPILAAIAKPTWEHPTAF